MRAALYASVCALILFPICVFANSLNIAEDEIDSWLRSHGVSQRAYKGADRIWLLKGANQNWDLARRSFIDECDDCMNVAEVVRLKNATIVIIGETSESGDWGATTAYLIKGDEVSSVLSVFSAWGWALSRRYSLLDNKLRLTESFYRELKTGRLQPRPADVDEWRHTPQFRVKLYRHRSDFPESLARHLATIKESSKAIGVAVIPSAARNLLFTPTTKPYLCHSERSEESAFEA